MSGDYKPRYLYEATYAQTCDCAYDRVAVRAKHAIKRKKSKKRRPDLKCTPFVRQVW